MASYQKKTQGEPGINSFFCVLFCIDQIKAKLGVAYKNAVKNYNSTGTVSSAVDVIQRTVSGRLSITLMVSLLSDGVCVSLWARHSCLCEALSKEQLNAARQRRCSALRGFAFFKLCFFLFVFFSHDR